MELSEILAITKKIVFAVGGLCMLYIAYMYYSNGKSRKGIQDASNDDEPIVKVRKCSPTAQDPEDADIDYSQNCEMSEQECGMIDLEEDDLSILADASIPLERRQKIAQELIDMGYVLSKETMNELELEY